MKYLLFFLIIYSNLNSQELIEYKGIDYPYSEEYNEIYYGHFFNMPKEMIQHQKELSKNRVCLVFNSKYYDSVTFILNNKKIYEGILYKNEVSFMLDSMKLDSLSILTMYSHLNKTKTDVILDPRANRIDLSWRKHEEIQDSKSYYWTIYFEYYPCGL